MHACMQPGPSSHSHSLFSLTLFFHNTKFTDIAERVMQLSLPPPSCIHCVRAGLLYMQEQHLHTSTTFCNCMHGQHKLFIPCMHVYIIIYIVFSRIAAAFEYSSHTSTHIEQNSSALDYSIAMAIEVRG